MGYTKKVTIDEFISDAAGIVDEVHRSSDRASAITAAAVLDDMLRILLEGHFIPSSNTASDFLKNHVLEFSARIDLCYCVGLISEAEEKDLHIIRRIRNSFAHSRLKVSFEHAGTRDRCRSLNLAKKFWETTKCEPEDTKLWFLSGWLLLSNALTHRIKRVRHRQSPRDVSMRQNILFR